MILIKNAMLLTMADINYEVKDVLLEGSKIKAIGKLNASDYPGVEVIDALEKFVTPGLVDPHCHIGLYEESIGFEGADGNEMTSPVTPELRAIDAIKPQDEAFVTAREAGVTTVATGPGSANCIGGTFTVIKTYGKTIDDMVLVKESSMKMALGENPKRVYSSKSQTPATRMGTAAVIREALQKAKDYKEKLDEYNQNIAANKEAKKPEFNMKNASLGRVFDGLPVKIHAHQQDDIVTAIRIIEEFGLNGTIEHATEGHLIPEYLKAHKTRLIIGPTLGSKSKYELRNKTFKSAKILKDYGIEFAIMTDHPVIHVSNNLTQLGLFVREGLNELDAFKAVTINAAKINGVDKFVGSIEVGKDADIVIWNGHPLHYMTKTDTVIVNGEIVYKA